MKKGLAILFLPVVLASVQGTAGGAAPSRDDLAAWAGQFAERFLDGRHEENLEKMTAEMKAASGPGPSEKLRSALIAHHGAVTDLGEPWFEDAIQGYLRFRVPVRFEQRTLDFRVVFDGEGRHAGFFIVPHVEPPRAEEAGPGRRIDVRVGEGETALPATLTLPEGVGPFPAVLFVHGSGPNDRDESIGPNRPFRDLAWGLVEQGIASLRYDKRSYSRPADLVALGAALTVKEEVIDDARLALQLLRERDEIDGARVFVLGHSLGGAILPRIAAEEPRPAGLIALAAATLPLPEKVLTQTRTIATLDGEVTNEEQVHLRAIEQQVHSLRAALDGIASPPEGSILGAPFGYYEDLEGHDPPAEAAALGLPILVLQGERDYQVTLEDFGRWEQALASKPFACLETYAGLDHLFRAGTGPSGPEDYNRQVPVDRGAIQDIALWIEEGRCPGTDRVPAAATGDESAASASN
jgi:dienelactone hydrolase